MLRLLPLACLLAAGCASVRPGPAVVPVPSDADPAALVPWEGGLAVATGAEVRLVRDGEVVRTVRFPDRVMGLAGRDTLWAATAAGLMSVAPGADQPAPVALADRDDVRALAVAVGPDGRVWATTLRDGAFVRGHDGRWTSAAGALPVTGVVAQAEAVWLGTHQGVERQSDGARARFTEEGTTEHGLADNVVDRLVGTADGAVWAVHPEGVSVFADGEPHGFQFVGRPGARLHDVVAVPGVGYVLATTNGVLVLPRLSERPEGFYEVYADSGADAVALSDLTPAALAGAVPTRLAVGADGRFLWLASRQGVWSVPVEALRVPPQS